jgi:hypothetical protein
MRMETSYVKARVLLYPMHRGGRPSVLIGDGYAPYVRIAGLASDLPIRINGMPRDGRYEVSYDVELELSYHPRIDYSQLREDVQIQIIEGPKVVGEGVVTSAVYLRV